MKESFNRSSEEIWSSIVFRRVGAQYISEAEGPGEVGGSIYNGFWRLTVHRRLPQPADLFRLPS